MYPCPVPAFSVELLKNGRWLIGAGGRATTPFWKGVETVTPAKQALFMQRLVFGFTVRRRQVKHVSTARLSVGQWEQLVETSCLLQEILDQMSAAVCDDGNQMFEAADVDKAKRRAVEGSLACCIKGPSYVPVLKHLFLGNPGKQTKALTPCGLAPPITDAPAPPITDAPCLARPGITAASCRTS